MVAYSSTPLVDLDDAKVHLNIDLDDDSQDAELQGFIDAASVYIQNIAGPVMSQQYVETHSGGSPIICLFNPPVLTVDEVIEYVGPTGYVLTEVALGDNTGTYAYSIDNPASGIIRRRWNGGIVGPFACGDHNVKVTYTAGLAAVPADLRMAVLQDIAGLFQPSQLGSVNPYSADMGNGPLNPVGMFPRVESILTAASTRTPSIA